MFFILADKRKPDIIRDEGRHITYQVLDVVKKREQRLSNSISDEEESASESSEEKEES